ncbi:unnamed protein product [Paramecium primaurelia]|uniref:Uncharacterized protein n=1 Tax=Paramecium primaurelia TaxID=5886 RepID=A0A8S1N695_PARPR|nr:unnamed protein product [Paramecium primaurelia]
MIGISFQSQQYYDYQDLKSLQDILKIDSIGSNFIYEDEQIIEYQIDRSKCLRLSDLIYLIKEKYFKLYLGQLLTLFNNLLEKVIQLQIEHNINHQYLDDNRIWLIFQDSNQCLNINYTYINYTIAFTGYQCQLYEQGQDLIIPAEQKIQQIIKDILNNFKNNKIYINDSQKDKIIKYIYDPIITECNKQNIQNTLKLLLDIQKQFKFNKEKQTIELDQNIIQLIDTSIIKKGIVQDYWKELIQNIIGESSFIIENVIISQIKHLIINLEHSSYHLIIYDKDVEVVNQLKSFQDKYKSIFEKKAQNIIQQQFENTLNKQMENYKFDIYEEEKKNILNSLLNRILKMKLNKYFQNSPHYFFKTDSNQLLQYQLNLITKLSQPIIIEEVELLIDFKNQMMIDQLI